MSLIFNTFAKTRIHIMKVGDIVKISPDLTMENSWVKGEVIDVKDNSFIGEVVSAKTDNGTIFFGRKELFESV